MTIQELINELNYSIMELGFDSNATVLVDLISEDGYSQHHRVEVDNTGTHMGILPINVYTQKED